VITLKLEPTHIRLADIQQIIAGPIKIELPDEAWRASERSRAHVQDALSSDVVAYGVNTGFGKLAQNRIDSGQLSTLQQNLVRSHAAGVGQPLRPGVVRLALCLKVISLAQGYSGVTPELIDRLIVMLANDMVPVIPEKGSVGASGDLAPLAHLALTLIGEGQVHFRGAILPTGQALDAMQLEPLKLEAKEGLALLNGTQISTALALDAVLEAERNLANAILIGAISVDAALGSYVPFDERIHRVRPHPGQQKVAAIFRGLLDDSEINRSHALCDRVQDPYSLRCQPQVLGACLDQLQHASEVFLREAVSVSDNPLIMPETGEILSGGNFHGEPIALAADTVALAIAEVGALSERRIAMLIDSSISELPPFLVEDAGLNSGFMVAHVTAASLASENKSLAHPASIDSLPTSANQEDHVSMATFAARRLAGINDNTQLILAIEYLAAVQGLEFRRPLRSTRSIEGAVEILRQEVPFWSTDREFAPDIQIAARLLAEGKPAKPVPPLLVDCSTQGG
jgi:histidine ammonia-lyase